MILVLSLFVSLFAGVTVKADTTTPVPFNKESTGSITVHKYANLDANKAPNSNVSGTGSSATTATPENTYKPLNGAKFNLYQLKDKNYVEQYYDGHSTVDDLPSGKAAILAAIEGETPVNGDTPVETAGEGDNAGQCTFNNLAVGIYVLVEVNAPSQITSNLMDPCLISIPMVNSASSNNGNTSWLYDVDVYPKNHESRGEVELTKKDGANGLEGVTFKLEKENAEGGYEPVSIVDNAGNPIKDGNTAVDYSALKTGAGGVLHIMDIPSGLAGQKYKLTETATLPGYILNKTPMYFTVNANNTITWVSANDADDFAGAEDQNKLNLTVQNYKPTLTKQISEDGNNWDQEGDFQIGDNVYFKITLSIPGNLSEYQNKFSVKDTCGSGIKLPTDSTEFTVKDGNTPIANTDYEINNATVSGFTFVPKADLAGKTIDIYYTGKMTGSATIDDTVTNNKNTAVLTYPKEIPVPDNDNPLTCTISDEVVAYTYSYEIQKSLKKADGSDGDTELFKNENVEFQLFRGEDTTTALYVVWDATNEYYRICDATTQNNTQTIKTDENGKIKIVGLDMAAYSLKEVKTVTGYNLLSSNFSINVNPDKLTNMTNKPFGGDTNPDTWVVNQYSSTDLNNNSQRESSSTVINKQGFVLPETGSMGYLLFCGAGLILVGAGAMLMFSGKKRRIQ